VLQTKTYRSKEINPADPAVAAAAAAPAPEQGSN